MFNPTPHASTSPCARRLLHGIAASLPAVCALCQLPRVHSFTWWLFQSTRHCHMLSLLQYIWPQPLLLPLLWTWRQRCGCEPHKSPKNKPKKKEEKEEEAKQSYQGCTVFENQPKSRIWIFAFLPCFKLTCLVTCLAASLRFSKTRQNGPLWASLMNFCPLKM